MSTQRRLGRVVTLPPPSPGQFGADHKAIEVIRPQQWADADPFILLMDDRIDGKLRGGPHPHAGFETVTFVVNGSIGSESGTGRLSESDVEWTTAGSGIIHGSTGIEGRMRVLQLWVTLPKKDRWTEPDHQFVPVADVPVRREPGVEVRLYSGTTGTTQSPTRNRVPMTLADIHLDPGASVEQQLPGSYNGFLYPLEGQVSVDTTALSTGQIGWLGREGDAITLSNPGNGKARVLLYSGERQNVPIVSYGPFIGDTREDIVRSFERYQSGVFTKY